MSQTVLPDPMTQQHAGASVPPAVISHLRGTRPWVLLFAVLGFLGAAGGAAVAALSAVVSVIKPDFPFPSGFFPVFFVLAVFSVASAIPFFFLVQYASAIDRLRSTGDWAFLELAVKHRKNCWRSLGIILLGSLLAYLIILAALRIGGWGASCSDSRA